MLFILYNNVVLSLFLRAFCCIFYTVFCILYTYFLHILYIFYTYFSHFIHFSCYFSSNIARLWPNITHFRVFLTYFRVFFLLFSVHLYKYCVYFYAYSHNFSLCQLLNFLYFCTNFFYTLHENCTCETHSFAQTFSSLPPHFSSL